MKDYVASLVRQNPSQATNVAREYLQARILACLQRGGAMVSLAFHGGTALRFLYSLPRHSEDLDFALERDPDRYDFHAYLKAIQAEFEREGYAVRLKVSDQKTVQNAFVRFPGLLHELGLSPHEEAVLSVKLEVDTRPPQGAGLETTVVQRHGLLHLQHHDRASLFAGKLHAFLQRRYTKGRDLYDLLWYLADPEPPAPNLQLLNNALRQTGWQGAQLTPESWRGVLRERLGGLDWRGVRSDVLPFLERPHEIELLSPENLIRLLA
ncbi:MAG TPA: nucleotidyl transferase AbiEii/AbiGii toxin family protein [Anaerolineales bacterium]|nr:nucleotidyl transferase AbiEii/AbiGii toxin family protein [Anaerolineales bacterium]